MYVFKKYIYIFPFMVILDLDPCHTSIQILVHRLVMFVCSRSHTLILQILIG